MDFRLSFDAPKGADAGYVVVAVKAGGNAAKVGIEVGTTIVNINDIDIKGTPKTAVIGLLQDSPDGIAKLLVKDERKALAKATNALLSNIF